ncbi:UNVERIFIED_CONTAM: Maf family nucleotide pyrophosphatase [Spiribacter pallidus]|uniref:Maf family protein n=1 Tax=Spiribacter pallidus TaxID=1987936 RepID=UPI00349FA7AD
MTPVILASSSRYRAMLLDRLGLDYEQHSPAIDESHQPGEDPEVYVCRLAREKAQAVAARVPGRVVIGSDQCSSRDGDILGKPHTRERAIEQLLGFGGRRVRIATAVAVYDPDSARTRSAYVPTDVYFRRLERSAVERYVDAESPLDCAGAFKAEGLGVTLFEKIRGDDPNALIGLPLIALTDLLAQLGIKRP